MEKFNCLYIFAYILNELVHLSHVSSTGKLKRSSRSKQFDVIQAEYEREQYEAYSSNTDLYTKWPELNISEQLNKESCKIYLRKLFPKKDLDPCSVTPSIKRVQLFYVSTIQSSSGLLIRGPVPLNSLECHIDPSSSHRKYFHFIRASKPECVYLINRRKQSSRNFHVSLGFCKHHTYNDLKCNKGLEGVYLCLSLPGKRKRSTASMSDEKRAGYEREQYEAYTSNKDLYTEWPELKISEQSYKEACKTYIEKLYPQKEFQQFTIVPSIKPVNLYYETPIFSSVGCLTRGPVTLDTLECYIDTPAIHRKYFHFLRTPQPECVFLINRREPNSMDFNISLRFCKHHTYSHLKNNEALEQAIDKQNKLGDPPRPRDGDSIKEQENYERSHHLWITQVSVEADTWPEMEGENQRIFCRKLLGKLYPMSILPLEKIHPRIYTETLSYTKLKNDKGFGIPLVKVFVLSCNTMPKIRKVGHSFIRAPNSGSLSCVYMIRRATVFLKYHRIIKRLCIQKLYESKGQEEAMTITTGADKQMNNENVLGQ